MTRMEGRMWRMEQVAVLQTALREEKEQRRLERIGRMVWVWDKEQLSAEERARLGEGERVVEDVYILTEERWRGPCMDVYLNVKLRERVTRDPQEHGQVWDWEGTLVGEMRADRQIRLTEECLEAYGYVMRNGAEPPD